MAQSAVVPRPLLGTVRVARGITQTELAHTAKISQGLLSKMESGLIPLDHRILPRIAAALNATTELLSEPDTENPAHVFHRKRSTLSVSKANSIRADLDLTHLHIERLFSGHASPAPIERRPLPDDGWETPEDVARKVRVELGVPAGPVDNLVDVLERAGVVVVTKDFGTPLIEALVSWPEGRVPVVLLARQSAPDRQRFTMAHELGHALMHRVPTDSQESEADRFASELLMPAAEIKSELDDVDVPRLAMLKAKWRVSMAALLRRAYDLDRISDSRYRQLNIELSKAGFRRREPVEIDAEIPDRVERLVIRRVEAGESLSAIAASALMTTEEFVETYGRNVA